jgi:hypothetical protein
LSKITAGAGLLLVLLAACSSAPPPGTVFVPKAPPRVVVEDPGPDPGTGWAFLPGYHAWNGERFVWVKGRWEKRPRPEAHWQPGRWVSCPKGWYWIEGRWD